MRKRSMSVYVPKDDKHLSRKFEGVPTVDDDDGISDDEEKSGALVKEVSEDLTANWTRADFDQLLLKLREACPKKDTKKFTTTLQNIQWNEIEVGHFSPDEVKKVTTSLVSKVRKFRTLGEIINDMPECISKIMAAAKPKPPPTARQLFLKDFTPRFRAQNEGQKGWAKDLLKRASEEFAQLSSKKRKKYEDMAEKLKAEQREKLAQFYKDRPDAAPTRPARRRSKPQTPFKLFFDERLAVSQITVALARQEWEDLPLKSKVKYIKRSFEQDSNVNLNKKEQELLDRAAGKPEFIGKNCYAFFRIKMEPDLADITGAANKKKRCDEMYRALDDRAQVELKMEYMAAKDSYIKEYQNYIAKLPEDRRQSELERLQDLLNKKKQTKKASGSGTSTSSALTNVKPSNDNVFSDEEPPAAESTAIAKKSKRDSVRKDLTPIVEQSLNSSTSGSIKKRKMSLSPAPLSPVAVSPAISKKGKRKDQTAVAAEQSFSFVSSPAAAIFSPSIKVERPNGEEVVRQSPVKEKVKKKKAEKQKHDKSGTDTTAAAAPTCPEPEKPPKQPLEFYRKYIYTGKVGKYKEAFNALSPKERKRISQQMKEAQDKYIADIGVYLKSLPVKQIRSYLEKIRLKEKEEAAMEEEASESESGSSSSEESD